MHLDVNITRALLFRPKSLEKYLHVDKRECERARELNHRVFWRLHRVIEAYSMCVHAKHSTHHVCL